MAQVKERGEGGEERKETALLLLPPPPSFIGFRFISRAAKTENPVPRSFIAPKPNGKASVIQTWLVEPFTEFKSAEHMAKIIQHKSQIRALKPISKCQERKCIKRSSKIKYLQIHKILFENVIFLKYRVQDVPAENSKKTSLLVCISKQAKGSDRLG